MCISCYCSFSNWSFFNSCENSLYNVDIRAVLDMWLADILSHPLASLVSQMVKNPPAVQETPVWFWVRKIPWRRDRLPTPVFLDFPGGSAGKESTCNLGDLGSVPGLGRSLGGGHGNPLQYSCLENSHAQRSLAGCSPWARKKSDMTEQLNTASPFSLFFLPSPQGLLKSQRF